MSDFKKITIEDKEWIDPIVQSSGVRCADYCFTNMYVWQDVYSLCAKRINDRLAVRLCGYLPDGSSLYSFPVGTGELYPVIEELRENAASRGQTLKMRGIPKAAAEELKAMYPELEFKYDRDSSDYIYSAEKLSTLAGKKLHAKRNHINRFIENNDWSFEPITPENLGEVIAMNCEWMTQYYEEKPRSYYEERQALSRVFADFPKLGLEGGLLRSGGRVIAYTLGERLTHDTYVLHFEKAFAEIQGAYAMINRENVKQILSLHPDIVYINREEDLGIEGLRKAKESYYPEFMEEKYSTVWSE